MRDFEINPSSEMALSGQGDPMRSQWDKVGALDSSTDLLAVGKGAYTSGAEKLSMLDTKTELNPSQSLNVAGTDSKDISKFVATSDPSSEATTGRKDPLTGMAESTPLVAPATTTADFNGDGQTDLVWRNSVTGRNVVWLMQGTQRSSVVSLPTVADRSWRIEGTGDFNGDNQTDLVWRNYETGNNSAWLMRGTRLVSSAPLPALSNPEWQLEGTGDFNGDNRTDLIWRNEDTGRSSIWLMNGTRFASGVSLLPTVASPDWQIRVSGDFNGDNNADIVWRNLATDQAVIWLMQGTRFASSASLPTFPGSWEVVGPR